MNDVVLMAEAKVIPPMGGISLMAAAEAECRAGYGPPKGINVAGYMDSRRWGSTRVGTFTYHYYRIIDSISQGLTP